TGGGTAGAGARLGVGAASRAARGPRCGRARGTYPQSARPLKKPLRAGSRGEYHTENIRSPSPAIAMPELPDAGTTRPTDPQAAPDSSRARQKRVGAVAVEIAPGELIDKITILEIKRERIADEAKLAHVRAELAALEAARDRQ